MVTIQPAPTIFNELFGPNHAWKKLQGALNRNGLNTHRALIPTITSIDFSNIRYEDRNGAGHGRTVVVGAGGMITLTVSALLVDFRAKQLFDSKRVSESMLIGPAVIETATGTTPEPKGGVQYFDAVSQLLLSSINKINVLGL